MNAQTLYAPLQLFADVCIQEKEAIRSESINKNDRFELLYTCMQTFANLPLKTGGSVLHPSNNLSIEKMAGHIVFSPSFINMYLQQNMTDSYLDVVPYIPGESDRAGQIDRAPNEYIYYHNSLIEPNSEVTFYYNVSVGEQQVVIIAEDDTQLAIEITSEAGTSILLNTNAPQNVTSQIWNEENPSVVHIKVNNPTNKSVSFVLAAH